MPESAIANVAVDHVLPVARIASLLAGLAPRPEARADEDMEETKDEDTVEVPPAMSPEAMSSDGNGPGPDEFDRLPDIVRHDQDEQRQGERHGRTSLSPARSAAARCGRPTRAS